MRECIVADTGPIIALSMVDHLYLLRHLSQRTLIPEIVHREILQGGQAAAGLQVYHQASWIEVHALHTPQDPSLVTLLDNGEVSVIQLAQEHQADCVLIDERKARKIARTVYNLHVIGTLRILLDAKKHGLIERIKEVTLNMQNSGYWIHDSIVDLALKEAKEE